MLIGSIHLVAGWKLEATLAGALLLAYPLMLQCAPVPEWDFNWQLQYCFTQPLTLPRGTQLTIIGHWDNSLENPNDSPPLKDIRFGEQSTDEMFSGYLGEL